ncbi:MAG: HAD-IG family 5'-nucleotidase [Archangium sp.]|nr:HAD-IG family 5'-nucleotidase [Archangium sp.]MDP3155284.1 HAD-IG family 5'-nucleotidase [Archangium sp.]MDP3570945.1 HAD-IG family 5'-nucleotidase [Archangium sp.]
MDSIHGSFRTTFDRQPAEAAELRAKELLSDEELQRILQQGPRNDTPVPRQVFVNRNLHMAKVDLIGFDMDYTLAIYHLRRLEQLSYDLTVDRLIANCGYPEDIRQVPYDHSFVLRGVFVDKVRGNLLKIDRFGYVGRAYHGRRLLADEEIQRLYRNERIRMKSTDYAWIDTLFALPEACLLAGIIELYETKLGKPLDYRKLYDDIREAIDTVHRDNSLKKIIRADIGKYIFKDEELGPALHKLRSGGKKLFVLTNSLWDYTNAVMSYLLDGVLPEYPSWKNYFDFIVTGGAKPGFFSEQKPFLSIDPLSDDNKVLGEATELERGKVYQGGNLIDFERITGYRGDAVLYVGDHIYGDILKSKKTSMWRTCMIVQEIEDELDYLESRRTEVDRLQGVEQLQARLDDEIAPRKAQLNQIERRLQKEHPSPELTAELEANFKSVKAELDRLRRAMRECTEIAKILEADIEKGFNPFWGLHFKEGNENSRFGEQVEQYACLYTSRVSNLIFYSPLHYYRSQRELMPHETATTFRLATLGSEGLPKGANRSADIP